MRKKPKVSTHRSADDLDDGYTLQSVGADEGEKIMSQKL